MAYTNWMTRCRDECVRSCWVLVFMLLCYMLYEHGMRMRDKNFDKLSQQLHMLRHEQQIALKKQENLLLEINSQSDPSWVELTLMRGLGLVPEGQTKVFFTTPSTR